MEDVLNKVRVLKEKLSRCNVRIEEAEKQRLVLLKKKDLLIERMVKEYGVNTLEELEAKLSATKVEFDRLAKEAEDKLDSAEKELTSS